MNLAIMGSQFRSGERQTESKEAARKSGLGGRQGQGLGLQAYVGKYRHFCGRGLPSAFGHSGTVICEAIPHCGNNKNGIAKARLAQVVPECQ